MSSSVAGSRWRCEEHGDVAPLWRPAQASYAAFVEQLAASGEHPTYLPWPLAAGWSVTDHGWVGRPGEAPRATMTGTAGPSEVDGGVEVVVVCEEPGTGLGAFTAGADEHAPGPDLASRPPLLRLRVERHGVALWSLPVPTRDHEADRTVLVGEQDGRWLWLVVRPAAAVLGLDGAWSLADAGGLGPLLVEVAFGGPRPGR